MSLLGRRLAWTQHRKRIALGTVVPDLTVRLLSTLTIDPLAPYLGETLRASFAPQVAIGGFDQIVQELFVAGAGTGTGTGTGTGVGDCVVVWPRFEDLWHGTWPLLEHDADATYDRLHEMVDVAVQRTLANGQTLVFVLPALPQAQPLGVGDAGNPYGVAAVCHAIRESLRTSLTSSPGALVVDAEEAVRLLGVSAAFDSRRMAAASIPYTEEAFASTGDRIARLITLSRRGTRKVAVVDADNTLWGGVVGEEGAAGVDLSGQGPGSSFREFQSFLVALRRAGLLVAVASKNNEPDAFAVFGRREMVLKRDQLAAWRINWDAKSRNLETMAEELNLSTASMVFVDDSAIERAEVAELLPEVGVLAMPEDPARWFDVIARSGLFDRLPPTASDLGRAESYATEHIGASYTRNCRAMSSCVGSSLWCRSSPRAMATSPGSTNSSPRPNQFTLGGERHNEAGLVAMLRTGAVGRLFPARDRFGEYGVIGAVLLRPCVPGGADALVLDSFVLSCPAMSRGIEDAMLAEAVALGASEVTVQETAKNAPARNWQAGYGLRQMGVTANVSAFDPSPDWPDHIVHDTGTIGP